MNRLLCCVLLLAACSTDGIIRYSRYEALDWHSGANEDYWDKCIQIVRELLDDVPSAKKLKKKELECVIHMHMEKCIDRMRAVGQFDAIADMEKYTAEMAKRRKDFCDTGGGPENLMVRRAFMELEQLYRFEEEARGPDGTMICPLPEGPAPLQLQ